MDFNNQWIDYMSMCVEAVDYSILLNNEAMGHVISGRGLRQGNPLSSYPFIICVEGLSSLIKSIEARGDLMSMAICGGVPPVSHLLFADDCFLFFKAEERQTSSDAKYSHNVGSNL